MIQKSKLGENLLIVASPNGKRSFDDASREESFRRTTDCSDENTASEDRIHILFGEDDPGEGVNFRLRATGGECGVTTMTSLSFVGVSMAILEEHWHKSEDKVMEE